MQIALNTIATHEAAHAVMRCLVGLPSTTITAGPDGGFCEGTGERCTAKQCLYVTLAGMAAECGYGLATVDFKHTRFEDLDAARALLDSSPLLRVAVNDGNACIEDVEAAVVRHFAEACRMLLAFCAEIEDLATRLETTGKLSAESVEAFMCSEIRPQLTAEDLALIYSFR